MSVKCQVCIKQPIAYLERSECPLERMLTFIDGKPYRVLANDANEALAKARVLADREAAEQATKSDK